MKGFQSLLNRILMYVWELPQNIVGLVLRMFVRGEKRKSIAGVNVFYKKGFSGGISLGNTIIVGNDFPFTAKHEHGHQIQSRILGPLYLFIIGIPSIVWAGLYGTKMFPYKYNGYYKFYTERWADKLGKVDRI